MRSPTRPDTLAALEALVDDLAAHDRDGLPDAALADQVLRLRRLVDRLEGQWLGDLAAVDGRGAAGAEQGIQAASTASWLRNRLHLGASAATSVVRTARALFRGLPHQTAAEAEPVLVEAAGRLDPPRLRRLVDHLRRAADPEAADRQVERQHEQRWLWLAPTLEGRVALQGLLDPEAGQTLLAALDPGPPGQC